ncbi:MAG: DUF1015 domain-containing protein [Flavobacteriales bacterium]|jgi:uncharacterized protein (DUF1015 family)|nr:DUF1015 domain-containing protein [Flavobacteriales bacterium]
MPKIIPFKGVRPPRNIAPLLPSRSFIDYTDKEIKNRIKDNPYSFLQIIEPDYLSSIEEKLKGIDKYHAIHDAYEGFKNNGFLLKEENEAIYVYRQSYEGFSFTGFILGVSVEDYVNDHIKKHEATIPKREEIFANYLNICGFNAEPVLMSYESNNDLDFILNETCEKLPILDHNTTDMIRHELWVIEDKEVITRLQKSFEKIDSFYIADGHHRSSSSAKVYQDFHQGETHPSAHYMAYVIPETQLSIFSYDRIIEMEANLIEEDFIAQLQEHFWVTIADSHQKVLDDNCIQMYWGKTWYILRLKLENYTIEQYVDELDSQILSNTILRPILGIYDVKNDKRVKFVPGNTDFREIEKRIGSDNSKLAFCLKPVKINQLKTVADKGLIMPAKSTFIEPKLRSGLVIYEY